MAIWENQRTHTWKSAQAASHVVFGWILFRSEIGLVGRGGGFYSWLLLIFRRWLGWRELGAVKGWRFFLWKEDRFRWEKKKDFVETDTMFSICIFLFFFLIYIYIYLIIEEAILEKVALDIALRLTLETYKYKQRREPLRSFHATKSTNSSNRWFSYRLNQT